VEKSRVYEVPKVFYIFPWFSRLGIGVCFFHVSPPGRSACSQRNPFRGNLREELGRLTVSQGRKSAGKGTGADVVTMINMEISTNGDTPIAGWFK
jgi:hypothetical protein